MHGSGGGTPRASSVAAALFASERLLVLELDEHGRIIRVNPMAARAAAGNLVGRTLRDVAPTGGEEATRAVEEVLRTGRGVTTLVVEETLYVQGSFEPLFEDGRVCGAIGVFVDAVHPDLGSTFDRLRFDELLASIAEVLLRAPSDGLSSAIVEILARVGTWQRFDCVMMRTMDGANLQSHTWSADPELTSHVARMLDLPGPAATLARGQGLFADHVQPFANGTSERELLDEAGVRSLCALPLRDEPNATLTFVSKSERRLTNVMRRRLAVIADLVAGSLHRRRLDRDAVRAMQERLAFEQMLSSIAAGFVECPSDGVDEAISRALVTITETLSLCGAAIFQPDSESASRMTHATPGEWSFKVDELFDTVSFQGMPKRDLLRSGELIVLRRDRMPPFIASRWGAAGGRAAIIVPMVLARKHHGSMALLYPTETVDEALVGRMRLIGDVIAHALIRKRAEDERAAAFAQLAARKASAERERDYLREQTRGTAFVVENPDFRRLVASLEVVARTNATILVRGETGVGKEVLARAIHDWSPRSDGPLVRVNCASIPRELFESEFFGHVRGAFTGAHRDRIGRFELADGGTLFLDEIGEVPLDLQSKLLRVLQEGEIERVGDDRTRKVDVRVIAATNRFLERDVEAGRFRSDLYYRLAVFPISVPPLRDRHEDIVPLARHFLGEHARRAGRPELSLSAADERALVEYPWPGNVRELGNVIERAVILSTGTHLALDIALPATPLGLGGPTASAPAKVQTVEELEVLARENIVRALEASRGQIAGRGGAAERLGLSPSTLRDRMRAFGVTTNSKRRTNGGG